MAASDSLRDQLNFWLQNFRNSDSVGKSSIGPLIWTSILWISWGDSFLRAGSIIA
ncbi:hypothetical protein ACQV5J_07880 [Leptospira interrogans]|uniref:hypothetical protein n=1 Tax=Leptospira interrogans TaxID=173 RepID=UPI0003119CE8|nr:hypothetical protein [Leptospira interrogans]